MKDSDTARLERAIGILVVGAAVAVMFAAALFVGYYTGGTP